MPCEAASCPARPVFGQRDVAPLNTRRKRVQVSVCRAHLNAIDNSPRTPCPFLLSDAAIARLRREGSPR
ncbi:MAG: hypothetical protein OXC11_08680 [Rhodospirillales bacterium]|nr:hypothetical protein [Rhodospirillales bacterium]